jgi:hypothetical protein
VSCALVVTGGAETGAGHEGCSGGTCARVRWEVVAGLAAVAYFFSEHVFSLNGGLGKVNMKTNSCAVGCRLDGRDLSNV